MKFQIQGPHKQGKITIPKSIWKAKNWEHGQELEIELNNKGNVELKEKS